MRYLGIDYGTKRIGIALSDEGGSFAFPHETIPNDASTIDRIQAILKKEGVTGIIVGDTRAFNGVANQITHEAESFVESLRDFVAVPITMASEAGTSQEAARFAPKGKEHDDAAAAAVMLQRYLDMHR